MASLYPQDELSGLEDQLENMAVEDNSHQPVYCWEDSEEDCTDDEDEEEDDYTLLMGHLNQCPQVLSRLLTTVRDLNESIQGLHCSTLTIEKNLRATESRVSVLEGQIGFLEVSTDQLKKTLQGSIPWERTMASGTTTTDWTSSFPQQSSATGPSDVLSQQLKSLREEAAEVYTPEVCCHFVKKEVMRCTTTEDRLVCLAKKACRLRQVQNLPNSNFWIQPKPLEPKVEDSLRSLPQHKQEEEMKLLWKDIQEIFGSPSCKTILLFEMEDKAEELGFNTIQQQIDFLRDYIQTGRMAQQEIKMASFTTDWTSSSSPQQSSATDPSDVLSQQLKRLREEAAEVYTPEVCCHFVKKEVMMYTTTEDRLVCLARRQSRLEQIKSFPISNKEIQPQPLETHVEEYLRSLPQHKQEEKMKLLWKDIQGIFSSPSCKTILLFEMEHKAKELGFNTIQQQIDFLKDYIQTGQMGHQEIKKQGSLFQFKQMVGLKKAKRMED